VHFMTLTHYPNSTLFPYTTLFRSINRLGIEFELAGFDLREVEYFADEVQKVLSGGIHTMQRLQRLFRAEARRVGDHHLGQADDEIGRAHVCTPVTWPSRMPSFALN